MPIRRCNRARASLSHFRRTFSCPGAGGDTCPEVPFLWADGPGRWRPDAGVQPHKLQGFRIR